MVSGDFLHATTQLVQVLAAVPNCTLAAYKAALCILAANGVLLAM